MPEVWCRDKVCLEQVMGAKVTTRNSKARTVMSVRWSYTAIYSARRFTAGTAWARYSTHHSARMRIAVFARLWNIYRETDLTFRMTLEYYSLREFKNLQLLLNPVDNIMATKTSSTGSLYPPYRMLGPATG
ncbi:hypothetical protein J6590_098526 [Homalodisca vitripennis]|nr:hypothetical protein J6590_098526 [Homalodisca vitripennis]